MEEMWVELQGRIQKHCSENGEFCCICFDKVADTAAITCGHKFFCYDYQ